MAFPSVGPTSAGLSALGSVARKSVSTWADEHEAEQLALEVEAPRTCNTGALISAPLISEKIDWLEFTVSGVLPDYAIREYLALDPALFTSLEYGMQSYPAAEQYGKVLVLHSPPKPERGTKIILSARALDEVGLDAMEIIKRVVRDGGTFARVDLALDDRTGLRSLSMIEAEVEACKDVNRFSQFEVRRPRCRRTRLPVGHSIYWGKPSSSRQLVIYDKEIERRSKASEETGPWVRCEARWKKRAANMLAQALLSGASLSSCIRGVIDFREKDNENETRRSVCTWWLDWTGKAEIVKTGIRKVIKTIEEKAGWLGPAVGKVMAQVCVLLGKETITEMMQAGFLRTTEKEWALLDPERRAVFKPGGSLDFVIPF